MHLRPFYINTVVWGEQFRDYFLEYCLPSLLSPRNIPFLDGKRPAKYLLATTAADWDAMRPTAIFAELEKHAEPVFLELPPKGDTPYWYHAILGHKLICDMAVADKAYRIQVCPDTVFSDGSIQLFHEVALDGAEVVLSLTSPLTSTDRFMKAFDELGLQPEKSARDTGTPIVIPPRQMVKLNMRAIHNAALINEWEAPYFCCYIAVPWWSVPGEIGCVESGARWDLYLLDYAAVQHDHAILDDRGFDGDYIMRTIGNLRSIYMVRDSDDFHVVAWAPPPEPPLDPHDRGELVKGVMFRKTAVNFNAMQRELLFMPKFVHAEPLNDKWLAAETKALKTLSTWIDPPDDLERYSKNLPPSLQKFVGMQARIDHCRLPWWRRNATIFHRLVLPAVTSYLDPQFRSNFWHRINFLPRINFRPRINLPPRINFLIARLTGIFRRISLVARGDADAREWIRWRLRKAMAHALRRPFNEPRPNVQTRPSS